MTDPAPPDHAHPDRAQHRSGRTNCGRIDWRCAAPIMLSGVAFTSAQVAVTILASFVQSIDPAPSLLTTANLLAPIGMMLIAALLILPGRRPAAHLLALGLLGLSAAAAAYAWSGAAWIPSTLYEIQTQGPAALTVAALGVLLISGGGNLTGLWVLRRAASGWRQFTLAGAQVGVTLVGSLLVQRLISWLWLGNARSDIAQHLLGFMAACLILGSALLVAGTWPRRGAAAPGPDQEAGDAGVADTGTGGEDTPLADAGAGSTLAPSWALAAGLTLCALAWTALQPASNLAAQSGNIFTAGWRSWSPGELALLGTGLLTVLMPLLWRRRPERAPKRTALLLGMGAVMLGTALSGLLIGAPDEAWNTALSLPALLAWSISLLARGLVLVWALWAAWQQRSRRGAAALLALGVGFELPANIGHLMGLGRGSGLPGLEYNRDPLGGLIAALVVAATLCALAAWLARARRVRAHR